MRLRYVGIVGAEAAKFDARTEAKARAIIRELLAPPESVLVSGGCHLGGVDIWAEEEYATLPDRCARPDPVIYLPAVLQWANGFKPRNIQIAMRSDVVHNITVARYPDTFTGMRFEICYHCRTTAHIKSGGCWTARYAQELGKEAYWRIV